MNRIAIDTHGYDRDPRQEDAPTPAEIERAYAILEQIAALVDEYRAIVAAWPGIPGYRRTP